MNRLTLYMEDQSTSIMYHANAALNITTDLLVAALLVRQIWKLQIAKKQKIALLMILTIGRVVVISIFRLYFLILVAKHPQDQTCGPAAYWSALEYNFAIVCASTPVLKPLIIQLVPMFGSRFGSSKRSKDNSGRSHDSRSNGFMRLNCKPSHSTMNEDVRLEHGITALPHTYQQRICGSKEIHVGRDFEQRSLNENEGRVSGDSRKEFYSGWEWARRQR
ncbi:hypothetical protein EK21DRAFT_113808 [Setomelanomma holmii]|uniref:Rhodopsin domain-containing protein n=1 Tax=Setomelanomma holmii TaxID=210430 RepID=A0A9P4LKQ8_9PLEO|nr:hypothetical protein EK21DRAFT_113808 [Setomelanomma holmii]